MNRKIVILGAAFTAVCAIPALAHHSFSAEYDANKPVEVKGVVAKVEWVNPHAYIYVDMKDASGKVSRYAFETSSPNALLRRGWKRSSLKEGETVTVQGYLAKDPRPLSDGSTGNSRERPVGHDERRQERLCGHLFRRWRSGEVGAGRLHRSTHHEHARFVSSIVAAAAITAHRGVRTRTADVRPRLAPPKPKGKKRFRRSPGGVVCRERRPGTRNLPPPPVGPTPHAPDGKPDLSGVWLSGNYSFGSTGGPLPLQPWAQKILDQRRSSQSKDDPEARCLPAGVPRITPYPFQLVQAPNLVVMLFEGNVHSYRLMYLGGRQHPADLDPSWMGDSIAKWEGDTLVVDTTNFNDKTWLTGGGAPHTDKLHVIERFTRPDLGHLNIDITLEDPGAFTKPHSFKRSHVLSATWEIHEYVCNEFNVDVDRLVGK